MRSACARHAFEPTSQRRWPPLRHGACVRESVRRQPGHAIRLVETSTLSPSVRGLVFQPLEGPLTYLAGESVDLTVLCPTGLAVRRPYSFASACGRLELGRFEVAVTRVERGPTSSALHALPLGAEILAQGPKASALCPTPDERARRLLVVATGSGLAPFRALVQERMAAGSNAATGVLFGCRTRADILWRPELEAWPHAPLCARVEITLSRPDADWTGRSGYVQRHLEPMVRAIDPELLMICGLAPMVDEVEHLARTLGVSARAIRTEAYDR